MCGLAVAMGVEVDVPDGTGTVLGVLLGVRYAATVVVVLRRRSP